MKILYNSVIDHIKNATGELIFAYCFAAFALTLFTWQLIDKIAKFTVVNDQLKFIFT